ncbi:glycoside hydrolase family 24 protein [Acinetobacter baumannii]|uniref:glycoside hydrolase family 24 protein n=1 Tax=Acinetobacter baumannii TaxID=470 RepID=UPI00280DAB73|nr:glycoside hydrolase family 104 protein [Acinetobacter baumannii]MDQ8938155.1 glycoside hydrolase family 104 protein [Acinetobacter baumannii]MDQ9851934.1 glycoside hydrolase family 104 protein [Acinetobacter baumannii]
MATSQQLMQLMNNPNARKMLDLIAATEGVEYGYNTLFGNQRLNDLSWHPNIKKPFKQTDGQVKYTTAAGRYQFLKDTWDGVAKQYGLKDFSPQSQDLGALALLAQNGALPYVLKGDFNTAIKKSGSTWASLPTSPYAQNKRSWDFINKQLGSEYQPESRFLSQDQIAKVLPQLSQKQPQQSRYLSQDEIAKVLPQLANKAAQDNGRFLTDEQIAQVLPQLSRG